MPARTTDTSKVKLPKANVGEADFEQNMKYREFFLGIKNGTTCNFVLKNSELNKRRNCLT
eukprot:UN00259